MSKAEPGHQGWGGLSLVKQSRGGEGGVRRGKEVGRGDLPPPPRYRCPGMLQWFHFIHFKHFVSTYHAPVLWQGPFCPVAAFTLL